jgi:hypothetical protein
MNRFHGLICSSGWWARSVERQLLPWGLDGVDLGEEVLEIGPGQALAVPSEVLDRAAAIAALCLPAIPGSASRCPCDVHTSARQSS